MTEQLLKLYNALQGKADAEKKEGSNAGRWTALILGVVAVVGVAVFMWRAWKKGKEIAKLKHERDVAEEDKLKAIADSKLSENEEVIEDAERRALTHKERVDALETKIEEDREKQEAYLEAIRNLKSWEEVDAALR